MIYILLNLLRWILWPKKWSILVKVRTILYLDEAVYQDQLCPINWWCCWVILLFTDLGSIREGRVQGKSYPHPIHFFTIPESFNMRKITWLNKNWLWRVILYAEPCTSMIFSIIYSIIMTSKMHTFF